MRAFLSPRWLLFHATVLALLVAFLWLGWWQLGRAAEGNALSFGYAFEWPLFAAFVILVWAREIRVARRGRRPETADLEHGASQPGASEHSASENAGSASPGSGSAVAPASVLRNTVPAPQRGPRPADQDRPDSELSEYNRYLRWLGEHPDQRPGDYRRATRA